MEALGRAESSVVGRVRRPELERPVTDSMERGATRLGGVAAEPALAPRYGVEEPLTLGVAGRVGRAGRLGVTEGREVDGRAGVAGRETDGAGREVEGCCGAGRAGAGREGAGDGVEGREFDGREGAGRWARASWNVPSRTSETAVNRTC